MVVVVVVVVAVDVGVAGDMVVFYVLVGGWHSRIVSSLVWGIQQ